MYLVSVSLLIENVFEKVHLDDLDVLDTLKCSDRQ